MVWENLRLFGAGCLGALGYTSYGWPDLRQHALNHKRLRNYSRTLLLLLCFALVRLGCFTYQSRQQVCVVTYSLGARHVHFNLSFTL